MKSFATLIAVVLAASALAGCANNGSDHEGNMTTPTGATNPTSMTPTPPTDDGEMAPMECHGDYDDEDAVGEKIGLPELQFTVKEPDAADPCFAFVGPRNATAGWNVFTLDYPAGGRTFHIMPMYFIGTHTLSDVMAAFESEDEPEWAVPAGAVGGVTPGESGSLAVELKPGSYMFFCPIEGHMMQGMMGILNVTAAVEQPRAAPTPDASVDLVDYNFTLPANISADAKIIKVTNKGTEPHEAPLVRLEGNATAMDFLMALEDPNATGPPPGALIGGSNAILPGQSVYMIVDLEAGKNYAMACFVESKTHGGAPHVELGMIKQFTAA